jgi:hypothetical protein
MNIEEEVTNNSKMKSVNHYNEILKGNKSIKRKREN